jgi:hypothetical protein
MMCDDWALYHELFMYFDMFYIQWHRLAKKDLWNKVYTNMNMTTLFQILVQYHYVYNLTLFHLCHLCETLLISIIILLLFIVKYYTFWPNWLSYGFISLLNFLWFRGWLA